MGADPKGGIEMARIEGEIFIGRPMDVVFDYVADQSNEPRYNPHTVTPNHLNTQRRQGCCPHGQAGGRCKASRDNRTRA
jgi:hypothetical protein